MRISSLILSAVAVLSITACEGNIVRRGYIPQKMELKQLQEAKTKADIKKILGTPTFVSQADGTSWIYTSYKTVQTAFLKPEFKNYYVMKIKFDKKGNITSRTVRNIKDKEFAQISDKTTTFSGGKETTFIREVFGNVGAVNPGLAYNSDDDNLK